MNRARELRSRIKEAEGNQGTADASSLASKSELQRQQRSRQLEAAQRLLDSQTSGINVTGFGSGNPVSKKSFDDEIRRSVGGRSGRALDGSETKTAVSQKTVNAHILYQERLPSKRTNSNQYFEGELDLTNMDKPTRHSSSIAVTDDDTHPTVREVAVEVKGRGRGRGRSRPSISGGESSVGEIPGSRKSQVVDDNILPARTRSPHSTSTMSSSSSSNRIHNMQVRRDDPSIRDHSSVQSYLRYATRAKRVSAHIF